MARGKKTGGSDFSSENQPKRKGRKPLPEDLRKATRLTKARLEGTINKYLWMSRDELQSKIRRSSTPMLEVIIGQIVWKAAVEGDPKRLDFILDRVIGKVKEQIDITTYLERVSGLSDREIIDVGEEALKLLQGGKDD